MRKEEFLAGLRSRLSGLPAEEREERLAFYAEMIDDRVEDGEPEEDAVAGIGSADAIVAQIMTEIPLSTLVREKAKSRRALRAWEIVLLVLGSPVWLSLLIAAFAVGLSLYIALWAVVVSLFAADLALAAGAAGGLALAAVYGGAGKLAEAGCAVGAAFVCAGLAILLFFGSRALAKGVVKLTRAVWLGVKTGLAGKEKES